MKYNQPHGISDPNAGYINGNPSTGTMGSIPPAASIEYPQREIANLITNAGLTPDNADLNQLARGIQSGKLIYGVDTGIASNYLLALTPPLLSYYDGLAVWMVASNANTGPASININGLGVRSIVRRGGAALGAGDIPQDYKSLLCYSALHSNFELYGTAFDVGSGFLPILQANTVLYVNDDTGDDDIYDGTTATVSAPHGPFKTINRALTETFRYGPSVYTMTVNIAAGTYPESVLTPQVPGPTTIFKGAGTTQTFVTGSASGSTFQVTGGNTMTVRDMHVSHPGTSSDRPACFMAGFNSTMVTKDTATGSTPSGAVYHAIGGYLAVGKNTFSAESSVYGVLSSTAGGNIGIIDGGVATVFTFNGTLYLGTYFANASNGASIIAGEGPYTTQFINPGFVNGSKYIVSTNGIITSASQGINFYPGNVAGSTSTGGQYS